jgi:hypothetical protein
MVTLILWTVLLTVYDREATYTTTDDSAKYQSESGVGRLVGAWWPISTDMSVSRRTTVKDCQHVGGHGRLRIALSIPEGFKSELLVPELSPFQPRRGMPRAL